MRMTFNDGTANMRKTLHPMQWLMAAAITAFCVTGTAAFMGWLPGSEAALKPELLTTEKPVPPVAVLTPADVSPMPKADPTPVNEAIAEPTKVIEPAAKPAPAPVVVKPKPVPAPVVAQMPRPAPQPSPVVQPVERYCPDCGVVTRVETLDRRGKGSGIGAIAGGVVGGLLGNQVGKGSGKDLATIAGAVIGGVAGHNVERNVTPTTRYRITVEMNDGSVRTIDQDEPPSWMAGDRVRVEGGRLSESGRANF
ncbi:glycine zipper 2TM domain-containing protein [Denitromonas halophila]|uniref:Glycine zipper 2TM domain-containing protein n=2 Tax=Denitromonas halophila TaxID=1629404 RepID=A0A557QKF9_9RHOO|nr:glycine zipper 2TM domain-containing protein [Denitromonas halophila]